MGLCTTCLAMSAEWDDVLTDDIAPPDSPPPAQTVVVFDWDDTLFPSTWIGARGLGLQSEVTPALIEELRSVEEAACTILSNALRCARVVIITNAESAWVQRSATHFVPRLCDWIAKCEVISARSTYEPLFPDRPDIWKQHVFATEVSRWIHDRVDNIVSIGDSMHERDAVYAATECVRDAVRTKSIKFMEKPTLPFLQRQLHLIASFMEHICNFESHLDLMMTAHILSS